MIAKIALCLLVILVVTIIGLFFLLCYVMSIVEEAERQMEEENGYYSRDTRSNADNNTDDNIPHNEQGN